MEKDSNSPNTTNSLKLKNEIEVVLITSLPEEYVIANNRVSIPGNFDPEKLRKLVQKLLNIREGENANKNFIFLNSY